MGCDIHGWVEVKYKGKWYAYDKISSDRSYTLFGFIAGVRDEAVKPVSLPKGIPVDASIIVKKEVLSLGVDGHSHTWLSMGEMQEVYNRFKANLEKGKDKKLDFLLGWHLGSLVGQLYLYGFNDYCEEVRMVIWFDN